MFPLKKKEKLIKISFILNGGLFLMGRIPLLDEGKYVFAIIQILAAILNIALIFNFKITRTKVYLNYAVLSMNVIVCLSVAIIAILSHKSYIQFAWFLAAIASSIALIIQINRNKRFPI